MCIVMDAIIIALDNFFWIAYYNTTLLKNDTLPFIKCTCVYIETILPCVLCTCLSIDVWDAKGCGR